MASEEEKHIGLNHSQGTLQTYPDPSNKLDVERLSTPDSKLALSEEEALKRSRLDPEQILPIYLTFAPKDRDNPRNWVTLKKSYITCFVSMLNVVTYAAHSQVTMGFSCWYFPKDVFAPVVSHQEPLESKRNSMCQPKLLLSLCHFTFWGLPLERFYSRRCQSTSVVNPFT